MKTLLRIHRYLGCMLAPMLLFFAVSGAWQARDLHESKKDGSYVAPAALHQLSEVHMNKRFEGPARMVYRVSVVAMSAAFVLAAGSVLSWRFGSRGRAGWWGSACCSTLLC